MTYEYDFEMVKRAYAEMARRAREKDEVRRPARNAMPQQPMKSMSDSFERQASALSPRTPTIAG